MTRPGGVVTAAQMIGQELADAKRQLATEQGWVTRLRGELAELRAEKDAEIAALRARLEQAEQYARDLQDEGVVPDGAVVVLRAYEAWQCIDGSPNCRRRFYADDPQHACGPLTPVTVTISRRTPS